MKNPLAVSKSGPGNGTGKKKSGGFQSMGLSHAVLKAILRMGYSVPTPIQRRAIPLILDGKDVVGMARTGSGKTAAFLVPLVEKLRCHSPKVGARALVLSPSRELALQTLKFTKDLCKFTDLRAAALVGGDSMDDQFSVFAGNPDIIVATPGRLLHLLVEMSFDLKLVEYVVFDEADRLFEMGFEVQLHEILHRLPESDMRQTILFSATLPRLLVDFAKAGLKPDPTLVRLDTDIKVSRELEMAFFTVKPAEKDAALLYILREVIKIPVDLEEAKFSKGAKSPQAIVFVATKHHVEYLNTLLSAKEYHVSCIYGSLDQSVRKLNLDRFRNGKTNILIVTDVAARGIDIPILDHVINYDFAPQSKVFIHRVGRVARAGRRGWAWSFVTHDEMPHLFDLQLFLSRPLLYSSTDDPILDADYTSQLVVGAIPFHLLQTDAEYVQSRLLEDVVLSAQHHVACNGYKLYLKSRAAAAPESHKRYKELTLAHPFGQGTHPLLQARLSAADRERQSLLSQLTAFRPSETIFEVGARGIKSESHIIMQRRRVVAASSIAKTRDRVEKSRAKAEADRASVLSKRPRAAEEDGGDGDSDLSDGALEDMGFVTQPEKKKATPKSKSKAPNSSSGATCKKAKTEKTDFRDGEFYMDHVPTDFNTEKGYAMNSTTSLARGAQSATMDLLGDQDHMRNGGARGKLTWDAKKKKFKRATVGADNVKLITGESGIKLPASLKTDRFAQWQKKTKIRLPRTGETELAQAKQMADAQGRKKWRHQPKPKANSELKSAQEIAKTRRVKEMRKEKNARPAHKRRK